MNTDSHDYAEASDTSNQNHSIISLPKIQRESLSYLDEQPHSLPIISAEIAGQTINIPHFPLTKKEKFNKSLSKVLKCLRRTIIRIVQINFPTYMGLNFLSLILLKYGYINSYVYLTSLLLFTIWFFFYRAILIFRNNARLWEMSIGNLHPLEQLAQNPQAENLNPNERPQQNNREVLRRRDVDNLIAFHPLRFHMIVNRLHNILGQLRENQMIISAAMGNRQDPYFEIQQLFNNGIDRNVSQSNGFTEQEIENLPQYLYEKIETTKDGKKLEEEEQCSICLMEFKSGETIRTLPCIHNFHKDCIDQWLKREKYCPLCKGEIVFN